MVRGLYRVSVSSDRSLYVFMGPQGGKRYGPRGRIVRWPGHCEVWPYIDRKRKCREQNLQSKWSVSSEWNQMGCSLGTIGEDRGLLTMFRGGYGIATDSDSASPIPHGMTCVRVCHDIRLESLRRTAASMTLSASLPAWMRWGYFWLSGSNEVRFRWL